MCRVRCNLTFGKRLIPVISDYTICFLERVFYRHHILNRRILMTHDSVNQRLLIGCIIPFHIGYDAAERTLRIVLRAAGIECFLFGCLFRVHRIQHNFTDISFDTP